MFFQSDVNEAAITIVPITGDQRVSHALFSLPYVMPQIVQPPAKPLPLNLVPPLPTIVKGGVARSFSVGCAGRPRVGVQDGSGGNMSTDGGGGVGVSDVVNDTANTVNCWIGENPTLAALLLLMGAWAVMK